MFELEEEVVLEGEETEIIVETMGEEVDEEIDALVVAKVIEVVFLMMETRMGLRLHSPPFYKKSTIIKTDIHPREPVMICNRVASIYIYRYK